jgi:outer membrane protease
MAQYRVDIIRCEVSFERYSLWVEADSEDHARDRVEQHYIDGEDNLTDQEENSEYYSGSIGIEETKFVRVDDVTEVRS